MVRRPLSFSRVAVQLWLARIGWLPIVALMGFVIAAALHFGLVPLIRERTLASQQALVELRAGRIESKAAYQFSTRYGEFLARLVPMKDRGNLLRSLFKTAADVGVNLAQADYRQKTDVDCDCQQLQIALPVRGAYLSIRKFVDTVLAENPALALDEVSFHREYVKNPSIDAQLRLTVYLREDD